MKYASYMKEFIGKHNKKNIVCSTRIKKNDDKKNIML
jgi:hypothetical protein